MFVRVNDNVYSLSLDTFVDPTDQLYQDCLSQGMNIPVFDTMDGFRDWAVSLGRVDLTYGDESARLKKLALAARNKRNSLLVKTDWRFRTDMNPSQAWIDYCIALRDVPQQAGFPESIIWPQEPVD